MRNTSLSLRYYLFSISNLLAAFGGGLVLGKGIGIINIPHLQNGSVLAFFIGSIFGLFFLQFVPRKFSTILSQWFSIFCSITSVTLFFLYMHYAQNNVLTGMSGLVFFLLLSIRFGFWFYSRVMRASNASGQEQSIAYVEFGYYLGMILGLVIWKLIGLEMNLGIALIIDAIFQLIAGILDIKGNALSISSSSKENPTLLSTTEILATQDSTKWCWKFALTVVLMTVGVQIIIFNLAHYTDEGFGSYILATFYLGVAVAAFIANKLKLFISWDNKKSIATVVFNQKITVNLLILISISAVAVLGAIISVHSISSAAIASVKTYTYIFVFTSIFLAALTYEMISLALLDRIGYEEKAVQSDGMIMKTYGLMGLSAAISLWILGLTENIFQSSIITLLSCLAFSTILILRRKAYGL